MARDSKNLLILDDPISGGTLGLYYTRMTTSERIAYSSEVHQLTSGADNEQLLAIWAICGHEHLTGFRPGDFTIDDQPVSLESDDWKDLLFALDGQNCDLLEVLGKHICDPINRPGEPKKKPKSGPQIAGKSSGPDAQVLVQNTTG